MKELWVKLVLTVPALFIALGAPLAGLMIDRWGRRGTLIGSTLLFGLCGGAGGTLDSLSWLLVSRALLGLAAGGTLTTTTALIADYYDDPERGRVLGQQAASRPSR